MIWKLLTSMLVLGCALPWGPAAFEFSAHDQHQGDKSQKPDKHNADGRATPPVFGSRDREIIGSYYRRWYSNLPPGLAKRYGTLPPGLERQLERNGTLPPGLRKRLEPFPMALNRQLPALPPSHVRGLLDGSAIVVDRRSWTIVDVINGVLSGPGR